VNSARFFQGLAAAFPGATALFVEGDPVADVDAFLRSAVEPGPYLPKPGTIWPKPKLYRLPFNATTLAGLAALAANHAEPEICYSLHVYASDRPLLQWWHAFDSDGPADVDPRSDPALLRTFAVAAGFRLKRVGEPDAPQPVAHRNPR
jgi:hypothetical protein